MVPDSQVDVIWPLACQLGEGVMWDAQAQRVLFVDIHGCRIHAWSPSTHARHSWPVAERVGWILPTQTPARYVVGLQSGFATLHLDVPHELTWLDRVFKDEPHMRLNDAKTDTQGCIWAGSLNNDDESKPEGRLFKLTPDGHVQVVDDGYAVCNGPAISPDGQLFLHTDSARQTIYAFDARDGALHHKRIWKTFSPEEGYPDGMTFDAQGQVWVAHWGGACVSQFDQSGALLQRIPLPTSHITNICFGGPRLDRMFVTSAKAGLTAQQLEAEPFAGALFEVHEHGATGLTITPFAA